jgi:hypothetical protein
MRARGCLPFRRNRALAAAFVLGAAVSLFGACSSTAKGVDACRRLETARCEKLASKDCNTDGAFQGDAASCSRFYDTQCGRGLQDGAREPSSTELKGCVDAIGSTCAIARDPVSATQCSVFLTPPVTPVADTGTATDTASADASEAATD